MRLIVILGILFSGHLIFAQGQDLKITGYQIDARLDVSKKQLFIEAELTIQKPRFSGGLSLLLSHHAIIDSVWLAGHTKIPFQQSAKDSLVIHLPGTLENSKKIVLTFSYALPVDSFMVHRGMVVMKRFERWYPLQNFELCNATITITVPGNLMTLSSGTSVKKMRSDNTATYEWKSGNICSLPLFIFNPDSMEYRSEIVEGTRINGYFVPGNKDATNIMSQVRNSLMFYSGYLGKYQYANFSVIEIPSDDFLGQAQQSLLLFTSKLMEYIPDPGSWVPHEVGHQWFGHTVIPDEHAQGRWFVEESINEYLRARYVERVYGADSLRRILREVYLANYNALVESGKDVPVLNVVSVNNSTEEAQSIYAKGPLILHQLRSCMGDKNWDAFIRKIYRDFGYRMFTLDDFKTGLSTYDPGGSCLNLLNTLLVSRGIPEGLCYD
ncbi:MAG: M1 family aminopeptidase [Bacteroidetes bacterium]|nr:M1 family aminopeptidase [Bacteroidota bacterium]